MISDELNSVTRMKLIIFKGTKNKFKKGWKKSKLIQRGEPAWPKQMFELIQHLNLPDLNLIVVFNQEKRRILART